MPITWPAAVTVATLKTEVTKLEARVTANEAALSALTAKVASLEASAVEFAQATSDHWVLRKELKDRNTAVRLGELEAFAVLNREALRALLTVSTPGTGMSPRDEADAVQLLLAYWLDTLGGRIELRVPEPSIINPTPQ